MLSCPNGLFANTINDLCDACTSPCATCANSSTTCLSCSTDNLFNNDCVATCPDSYYALSNECLNCQVGCSTCSSASICLTCSLNYYFYNESLMPTKSIRFKLHHSSCAISYFLQSYTDNKLSHALYSTMPC